MNTEEMVFDDLAPIEVKVVIGKTKYVLVEASAGAVVKYRNALMKMTATGAGRLFATKAGPKQNLPCWRNACLSATTTTAKKSAGLSRLDKSYRGRTALPGRCSTGSRKSVLTSF